MLDHHLHVWPHEPGTPTPGFDLLERYCEAATQRGIEQIAITEHSHRFSRIVDEVFPHWDRPHDGDLADATAHILDVEGGGDLDAYVAALRDAQDRGLPLLIGLEVDFLPVTTEAMAAVTSDYPFDILLGSVHWLDAWLFDDYGTPAFAHQWEARDVDEVYANYVDSIIELAESGTVDVLAHLDVIKVAGHLPNRPNEYADRLVEALPPTGLTIEFSSAGLRKPANDTYPHVGLLRRLVDAGMAVTTSSDGHVIDHIGYSFDVLAGHLGTAGVSSLTSFDRRRPVPRPV